MLTGIWVIAGSCFFAGIKNMKNIVIYMAIMW